LKLASTPTGRQTEASVSERIAGIPLPSLATLIILGVGFRLTALFLTRFGSAVPDWSDFAFYHEVGALAAQGFFPDVHFWVEYPPILPWISVAAFRFSQLMPPWPQPLFWFDLFMSGVLAVGDAGAIVAIDRLGDAIWGRPAGRRSAAIYAAMFVPAWALLAWFDTLPTSCLLIGLAIIVTRSGIGKRSDPIRVEQAPEEVAPRSARRAALAGFFAGLGFMLKIFPVLALPAALVVGASPRTIESNGARSSRLSVVGDPRLRATAIAIGTAVLTGIAIVLPLYLSSHEMIFASFRNILARGSWESPWALLDGNTGTGLVASLNDRLFFTDSSAWGTPQRYPAVWLIAALLSAAVFGWRLLAARRLGTPRAAIALTGFGITLLLLLSRGFSPQFILWVLPFVVLFLPGIDGALLAVVLTFNNLVIEAYLYATLFQQAFWLLYLAIAIRTLILLWLLFEFGSAIDERSFVRWHKYRRYFRWPGLAALVIAAGIVVGVVWPNIRTATIERAGAGPLLVALKDAPPGSAVVFTQPDVYARLAWVVRPRQSILLAQPKFLEWTGEQSLNARLMASLANVPEVTILTDSADQSSPLVPAIGRWLDAHYGRSPERTIGSIHLTEFRASDRPAETAVGASFGGQIELRGYSPSGLRGRPGQTLGFTLHWRALAAMDRDYTVSVQLLNPDGSLAVQHDAMPVENSYPTSTWPVGSEVFDRIEVPLPPTLATGTYTLVVVVYHQPTSARLPVSGSGAAGDHAAITSVAVGP
jgi:hypothetical protein